MPKGMYVERAATIISLRDAGHGQVAIKRLHELAWHVEQRRVGRQRFSGPLTAPSAH